MGSNFHGIQIFVDFVGSLHPRKFYFALIFGASRDRLLLVTLHLIDPLYRENKEAAAEINFGMWPIISPSSLITATIIIIMFYSVQNQCTDGPLASCASGQSTTYINY